MTMYNQVRCRGQPYSARGSKNPRLVFDKVELMSLPPKSGKTKLELFFKISDSHKS